MESFRDVQKESDQSPHENKLVQQTCLHWNISPHLLSSVHVCNHLADHGPLARPCFPHSIVILSIMILSSDSITFLLSSMIF